MNDLFGIQQSLKNLGIHESNLGSSTGLNWLDSGAASLASFSPADGKKIASVQLATEETYEAVVTQAQVAFESWRLVPAPQRGEIVREIGNALREVKADLGKLVSYEMGKSYQEGLGEVQEMIDICDFAVGLSRQLYGLTMHSERPGHRMYEQWHALGIVGIISAFNFPVAVWSWNTALAWVCGDVCLWKPSEKAPLSGIACQHIVVKIFAKHCLPEGISNLIVGDASIGALLSQDPRIPLVSATGSTRMGKQVGKAVGERLGRSLLELGGNNAIIITENADLEIAIRGALFGAVGTAGQRCTTTRRLIVQEKVYEEVKKRLASAFSKLVIGNPLDEKNHVGPLIDVQAVEQYLAAIVQVKAAGGKAVVEGGVLSGTGYESGCYVKPAIYEAENHFDIV